MNTAVSRLRKSMSLERKLEDRNIEKAFNKSMGGLIDSLPAINKSRKRESDSKNRYAILQKASELLQSKKLSLLDVGIIESRLNKGQELSKTHIAALGLNDLQKGFEDLTSGVLKVDQANEKGESLRAEREPDSISANKQIGDYSFINLKGDNITVSRAEILRAVGKAFKVEKLDLVTAGQVEYRLNHAGKLSDDILRYLFE